MKPADCLFIIEQLQQMTAAVKEVVIWFGA
jgi:hypothetical protein